MPINSKVKKLYDALKADGGDVGTPEEFNSWFFKPGKEGYKNRKSVYDTFKADGADVGKNYEEFGKWLGIHAVYPTVNKYHQQMLNSVDPNKSRASELTRKAVGQAVRATNNVRKPVVAKVVNRKGKPTGEKFAITPAKTVEDLDREYAQETTKNWENELHDQMADADKDAAKISDMFKSFIGSTDEVGSVWGNMTRGGGIAGTPHSVTTNNGILENAEARQILAAGEYNRKRRELLQLEKDSRNGVIFDDHSFWRGMYDAAKDTGFLTGGASDLINSGSLLATKQDLDNGVHTEAGDMLLQQAVKNSDAQSQYGDNQGWMYTGGIITTNMAPFITQIASAGFSEGMSTSIGKVVQSAASKVALGTMEKATGMAGAHIANYIGKVTGLTTKAFGKAIQYGIVGAAQANTVGLGNVANDVVNRYTGQVYQDEQGNYKFGTFDSDGKLVHEGGEDFLTSLVKGEAAQTIEFATELAGGGIDAVGTALKNFVTKGGKKIINKYNMENVSKVIDFLLNNKVSKNARYLKAGADRTLGKVELNSIVGESLEEELGIIANTVFTGDNKISDLWDEKQQSQIWGGMLLSIGLMKGAVAPFHAYNAKQYYSYKHKLNKADVNLSQLLGKEKWDELRNKIDATTNKDMPEMINKINRDVALGKNRQPVREYIQNLLIMRGYDIGNMLAAKKAVEDRGKGVSVKNMEKNQAYQQGRDAYGYDTHEIQLDQADKQKTLAQLLGITEQQLSTMSDEELDNLSGRDDNLDKAIYDYQLSTIRYQGVADNAQDQVDLAAQKAAKAVDMYTDKSRNTIRNATIKATGGLEDYGVYIINGNIATNDDGSIDVGNSDDMILFYDPTTNTVEHADATRFAELGSEENADEVRNQAVADAKENAIKEITGIIDGVVEVGTQFKTIDADGTEHTYDVLADNGDGTAIINIDGNIHTQLVKGENVQVPVSFEELQKMKDASDQQRLQAAKAQREQMEKERAEQQKQAQNAQVENPAQHNNSQPAPIEDNLDYSEIIQQNGKVNMVDVSDKEGNNMFPDAKDVFLIQGNKTRTKFAYIDPNGEVKVQSFPTSLVKVKSKGEVSVDEYKKYRQDLLAAESPAMDETSMIEENRGAIEADRGEIEVAEPIGTGTFGNIYNQFKGKVKEAFNFLMRHKSGDLLGVFHRDDVGDIDLVWGDEKMGLAHILGKHVGEGKDFETPDDAIAMIENVINSGRIFQDNQNRYTLMLDGVGVGIRKSFDGEKKNWIVAAVDFNRSQEEKGIVTNPTSTSHGVTESESAAALNDSDGKDINNSANGNENNESLTFEDGTPIPVDESGETDLSQTDAAHAAEWYDTNLGEDADDYLDGEIKKYKKLLEQAKNKKLTGNKPSELVASKKEKEATIAKAQAVYNSAISIRDALKERRITKEENTPEGRKNLIDKARRKFARLKSAVKDDAEAVSQLYKDVVGSLLHRLYDSTGIDVTDTIPLTAEEYVASNLGAHSLNYEGTETSKGVKQETGLSREDFAKTQLLAADGKGTTIDDLVHSLWENRPSNLESLNTQDIRNALIDVLTSGFKASEARNYVENLRIAQAENFLEEQKKAADNAAFAEEQTTPAEQQTETAPESDEQTGEENSDEINDEEDEKINEQTNENINAPEVPEDATDENPLGLQLSEDKVPFLIDGEKSGTTYDINDKEDRQRLVAENSVDDKDILDIDMPEHVHKAIKELCKKMGLKVQFLYMGARLNGWVENGTMYLALDTEKATQFVFGHEMTHAIKQKNPEAYKELVKVAMAVTTKKKFEEDLAKVYRIYHNASGYNNIDDFVEEVIADNIGKFINDYDFAQKIALRLNHPVLATILHAIQKIKGLLYGDPYKSVDALERIVEKAYVDTANGEITNSETGEDVSFSLRQKPEPKKKGIGYKVFVLKDGKLYPPMVANPDGAATPVGVWLDADAAPIAGESKTGRPQVKQGGKGTQGGSGKLAYRPGWHLGVVPYAIQFNRKDAEGNKTLFPKNFVFAEVEYAADVDYQEEARQEGINPSGKYQHSLAGLKHLPTDGYYMYRTNPNPETDPWVITGAMKVNRILTRAEQAELVKNAGREPQQIQEGDIVTDDVVNSINQEIADAPKFSLKVYHGSGADFTEFDFDHMGEGAGSQVFGWGGYVTSSKKIGKSYAEVGQQSAESRRSSYDDTPLEAAVGSILGQEMYNYMQAKTFEQKKAQAIKNAENSIASYSEMLKNSNELDEKGKKFLQKSIEEDKKELEVLRTLTEEQYKEEYIKQGRAKNLYEVDIPDDNGSNYLEWENPLTEEQINTIRDALAKKGVDVSSWENRGFKLDLPFKNVYAAVLPMMMRCEPKEVSKFLSSLGFTGIKYPAGTIMGGAEEGDTNYVIFKPEDMKITEHTKFSLKDNQGNPLNQDGTLKLDKIKSVDELTDEDFLHPTRNVELPKLPKKIADAIGTEGKPVVIKKNIFERNYMRHKDVTPELSKAIFKSALYNPDLYGQNQKKTRPYNWVLINTKDEKGNNRTVLLEVNPNKDNVEIVHWHFVNDKNLGLIKKQAIREGDQVLILPSEKSEEVGGLSNLTDDLSAAKIDNSSETAKENGEKVDGEGTKFSLKDEKIKSIAEKFGVNEDDVAMYANAVERGSTADAARARANIKRYLLQANEDKISSFKDIIKYTKPINEALKENFGDLDAMIEERRKQVEAERNAMEAARKRAQEEEEKRQKHLEELSLIPTDELDKRYMDAIANKDEATAREMLDESARRKGYDDADSDYQGQGAWAAPSNPQYESDKERRADIDNAPDVNLEDIALGYSLQPDDYFDNPRAYMNNTAYGLESAHVIKNALDAIKNGEKDVKVKVYRAVPTSVKEGKLRNGDWVTPSKKYAEMHGDNRLEGKYRIIEDEVPANQLWWDGNDANEFGFDDGKEYRYKNAKNNRKLNDLITYDNKGNVIPPSKRFNSRKSDIRFSLKEEKEKIVAGAKANGTYMTAPNGEKTKLDAEQWATVRTTNFKNWFGDWENDPENASKVVDENGEPMVVWHGRSAEFNTFEKKEGVRFIMGLEDKVKAEGFFFSPDKGLAEEFASNSSRHRGGKANVVPCFLNIRRPMDLTGEDYDKIYEDVTGWEYMVGMDTQDNLWGIMDEEGMADKIKEKGYDGAIFVEEVDDSYEPTKISYCALDANQIKSAENNNGDFSADNNDIRFSLKSMMTKPEGWKQANKKAIHIAEAIERDPKFSLKNLDGTLIKAGTYFSGGGLVEEGLKGIIDPVVAVEYDEKISGVYRNNFGQHIVTADVRDVDPRELVKQIDGEVEYFHASPVCKNYSQAKSNHAEVELDKETAASTAEFINAVKPKVVTIENVKGYKDSDAMKTITDALDANGYTWDADVYNAADYGGYTNRERLIVRAVRDGKLPEKPKKMAHKSGWYEAVADIIPTLTEKKNGVAPWMDIRLKTDGIDWRNIDKPLYVMGSAYADGKVPHAFADELLPTLRTKSGDVIVMPDGKVYRAMGRVLARVSGVSDDYKMPFSENLSHTIIGNGIPTQLTEHVIAPLLQNTLRPTTPDEGNSKFSLRGSTPYDKQMEEWKEKNHLEKDAAPMEKPIKQDDENIFDYMNRMVEWTRNQNLWKTAPKQTGFQDALDKWKADNGLSPDAYPPVRPHRENYSTEIGYAEDLEEYNKKKELWKSAPKPKDFDLSVDLEDMNKQLRNIRRAVLNQKNYDQRTVKAVSDLVRKMLNIGWGDGLSRGKVGNLLSAAKNATGANDVKKYLDKAMGILADNYLNRLSTSYDNLINTKGARADQSGVIKMGSLDAKGQAFMSEYKKAINMDDKSLNTYIANIEEDSAKNEGNVEMNDYRLAGIQAAIMFKQQIGGNDADIAELQRQIGELKNKKDATKEDKDLLKSLEKKLFENKFDRITMYENLLNNIQRMVKESKGRAKEFREELAEHKNEILHRANLDLEGVDSTYYDTTTAKKKLVNNDLQRAVFSSTYTFEQFLKFFGKKAANGEGYLYNYFTKLNQDALDEEQLYNEMNRNALDEKTKELFGKKRFMKLVGIDGKGMKEMDIEVTDYSNKKTGKRTIHLKQGQMLYIYLVNKETDGEMKLRAMGITEEDVAAIEENLDPRVKAMGEWLQDEYLPECQRRYQATHTKYFGAPMKEVENYFPLAINNRARNVKEDVNQDSDAMSQLAGTSTGAIVTRRVNVIPLDIENADAFEVAFNHLQEMEEWSAMLPFRQDVNTLLSYTHFRNQVQNMSSVAYGSGKTLWDEFKQTAQIAAGTYKPKVNAGMMDSRIAAAMGGIAVAKISGRLWTAIKQSQSATVFLPECDFTRFVKNGVNPYGSWKWAMENIPDFRKRVENMTYGDVKLRQYLDELEKWHDWTKTISKIGMAPNILVDGITCAVGARSVYETEVNRMTKLGYPKEKAEEKAYYKSVAAYNKTQQSSGGMYLSPMQVDRTYVSAALSLFKNANFAYGRMQIEACRGLARTYDLWGGKHKTALIESMTRQIMEEDGLDENAARAIAKATYNRTFRQSIGRLINFATLVPISWALYKVLPYLLTGDDDDKKTDMIEEGVLKGFATSLSDNYVIPFASNILNAGLKVEDGKPTFDPEVFRYQNLYINPATSDLANIYSMIGNQKWYSVANKLGMLGVQSLIGFNPETVGALYQAFAEADYDNGNTAKEWQIGILKAISAPEESIRELYMDELGLKSGDKDAMKKFMSLAGLDADDIKKVPLSELEKRYAERQINRDNLLSQIGMDAETFNGYVDKYQKSFEKKIKDKMDKWDEYDKKKIDEFFDTTSDPKLKDMIAKKRAKDANAAADEQIAKEGLNQEKKGKEPSEEAYDAVKMSIDVAEDNVISTYNKVLNKRYAALNDEYNNQTDAMKYIFMSNHPNFKAYKDIESEYTNYGKKMKELKEKLVSADGYDAKQTILKQIRAERDKFYELQSKVR